MVELNCTSSHRRSQRSVEPEEVTVKGSQWRSIAGASEPPWPGPQPDHSAALSRGPGATGCVRTPRRHHSRRALINSRDSRCNLLLNSSLQGKGTQAQAMPLCVVGESEPLSPAVQRPASGISARGDAAGRLSPIPAHAVEDLQLSFWSRRSQNRLKSGQMNHNIRTRENV